MPDINSLKNKIEELVLSSMRGYRVTGASVSIIDGGGTVFCKGFGFADVKNKKSVDPGTVFKIGSITKVFTASAIMQLAEQGKINIDSPVKAYIPGFQAKNRFKNSREITVRDLLCHHSGLPCDDLKDYFSPDPEAFNSSVAYLKNAYAPYPPGYMFYYSNLGYDLLGVIIENVQGVKYHEYMENVLLKGLGMNDSAMVLPSQMAGRLAKPYSQGREQAAEMFMKEFPAGGIFSTAEDMAGFMRSIISGGKGIFKDPGTLEQIFKVQHPVNPFDLNMNNGLGWFSGKPGLDHAGRVFWHDGGTPNYFSLTIVMPDMKLGITLLTNCRSGAIFNHTVSTDILQLLIKEKTGLNPPTPDRSPAALSPEDIKRISGDYITLSGPVNIARPGARLIVRMPSGSFILTPCRDGWFTVKLMLFGFLPLNLKQLSLMRFSVLSINNERFLSSEQLGLRSLIGRELNPLKTAPVWEKIAGAYICVNDRNPRLKKIIVSRTGKGMCITADAEKLGRLRMHLDVISDNEAIIAGMGRYTGETVFLKDGTITLLGLEFKKST